MSKEAFDCCPWPSNDFSNKGNILETVEKAIIMTFSTLFISLRDVFGVRFFFLMQNLNIQIG